MYLEQSEAVGLININKGITNTQPLMKVVSK